MSLDSALALVSAQRNDPGSGEIRHALEGVVMAGSWDAANATVQVLVGDTALNAVLPDSYDQAEIVTATLAVSQIGDQYGPVGGERVVLHQSQGSWVALFEHGVDDTPGAPSGERWIAHRNASGVIDAYLKLTNDGPTTGDALGGTLLGGSGALTKATTKSGHSIALNDTAKTIETKTAGGLQGLLDDASQQISHIANSASTVIDGAANTISHIAGSVGVGNAFAALPATQAPIANADLSTFENSLHTQRLADLENLATAVSEGLAQASPAVTLSASVIIGLIASLAHISVPPGSSSVRVTP